MGVAPTYRSFEIQGISIIRLANGQIVEDWTQADSLTLMQQLGIMVTPVEVG